MTAVFIVFIVFAFIFGTGIISVFTEHRRKVLEMQLKMQQGADSGLRAELDALKREVNALRDTATQYDISFDAALQRMDGRVQHLEQKKYFQQDDMAPQNLTLGR